MSFHQSGSRLLGYALDWGLLFDSHCRGSGRLLYTLTNSSEPRGHDLVLKLTDSHPTLCCRLCFWSPLHYCLHLSWGKQLGLKSVYCAEKHSPRRWTPEWFHQLGEWGAAHVMDCSWTIHHGLEISNAVSLVWAGVLPYETVLKF